MIGKLSVKNFKSIKSLDLDCRRVNLFIGEPNTGKSNILEALGLLSWFGHHTENGPLSDYLRFKGIQNLFFDDQIDQPIEISTRNGQKWQFAINFENNSFRVLSNARENQNAISSFDISGNLSGQLPFRIERFNFIKYYKFKMRKDFKDQFRSYLEPPDGPNLFSVIWSRKKIRDNIALFFKPYGFNLIMRPQELTFELQKLEEDTAIAYPYHTISDTLQRIVFYTVAIESNENSTLVFEEPEAHTFPYYTKYIGEKVARDDKNQYFIATHNPYFLEAVLEKAKKEDVAVFVTHIKDYQTRVKHLSDEQISDMMSQDPFLSLNKLVGEENV